jgi:hypothetical protein
MAPDIVLENSDIRSQDELEVYPMGVDYGWEKFFSSIHHAVTSTELLQKRLQVVVNGIDGLRRDSFPSDESYERFEKLMTATKMLPARGNEGRLAVTTSQMEESEARQWLQEAVALFSDVAQAYGQERTRPTSFPTYPKTT